MFTENLKNILLFLFMNESYYLHLMESGGEILDGDPTKKNKKGKNKLNLFEA